jgi:hypothetical protein
VAVKRAVGKVLVVVEDPQVAFAVEVATKICQDLASSP